MVALSRQVDRLDCRALAAEGLPGRRVEGPAGEVALAKRRLWLEGERLHVELESLLLPVARGAREHPWRTVAVAATGGAAAGWVDEVSDGRLHRLVFKGLRPFLRTLIHRASLKGL